MQIIITLNESTLLIFSAIRGEKLLVRLDPAWIPSWTLISKYVHGLSLQCDGSRPKFFDIFATQVGSATSGSEKFPPITFFTFGSKKYHLVRPKNTWVEARSAPYLLQVRSMLGSGQSPKYLAKQSKVKEHLLAKVQCL